jgi:hypothetical protein
MIDSSPDKLYGREFARSNWARVREMKYMYMGESSRENSREKQLYMSDTSPDKIYMWVSVRQLTIWVHIRQIMFMADCNSPDEIYYGRELARNNIWVRVRQT